MARIRSIKPEFWADRKLARLPRDARLLYIALWNQADEHGRVNGDTRYIKGHCFPYDDDLSLSSIDALLGRLSDAGRLVRYEVDGDPFLFLPKLADHQRLEPKVASKLPAPPSEPRADESASDPDEPALGAVSSGEVSALHVAGSMEHVRGSDPADAGRREDVDRLCDAMASAVESNGSRRPLITPKWRQQARLLLDNDGRAESEALALIGWAAADPFWAPNVMSIPKFREKYDQLRLKRDGQRREPEREDMSHLPESMRF